MDATGARWSMAVGIVGLLAAAVMGVLLVTDEDPAYEATAEGFIVEPAASVGPDAFTPSFDTEDAAVCDVGRFVAELSARPEALSEWARILGVDVQDVPAYAASLQPMVLDRDTTVTNHGLRDGVAYARPSVLPAGTAVLMGDLPPQVDVPPAESVPTTPTTTVTTPPTVPPTTVVDGDEVPVTRCRCGNPLLPAYAPSGEAPPAVTTTTTTLPLPNTQDLPDDPVFEPPPSSEVLPPEPTDDVTPSTPEPTDDVPPDQNEPDDVPY